MNNQSQGAIVVVGSAAALGGAVLQRLRVDQPDAPAWISYRSDRDSAEAAAAAVANTRAIEVDLEQPSHYGALAAAVRERSSHLQTLVHAVVDPKMGSLLKVGMAGVESVLRSGALSLLGLVEAFDDMLKEGSSIVFITSVGSQRVVPAYGAVGTAKAAGEALMRYLAADLALRGVRVNAVSPGLFASKAAGRVVGGDVEARLRATDAATPRGKRIGLDEMADAVAYLVGPQSSGITGQILTVDGGVFHRWSVS